MEKTVTQQDLDIEKLNGKMDVFAEKLDTINKTIEGMGSNLSKIIESMPAVRSELTIVNGVTQENKLNITALDVRVKALEVKNLEQKSEKIGVKHLWRNILAVTGFLGLVASLIYTIITIIQHLKSS